AVAIAKNTAIIRGTIKDELGTTLPNASIVLVENGSGVSADADGRYELIIPADRTVEIKYSFAGLLPWNEFVELAAGTERTINVSLRLHTLPQLVVEGSRQQRERGVEPIDPRITRFSPTPLGGVESLLQGQVGVVMRNELSSGYSVRGGNFDENLVYVNDIEVYRPFLVRAGQQEGLSFPNPDMIERLEFSAGGFEARYGDKMSSVLDIQYKRPKAFAGSAMLSMLGGAVHVEDAMLKKRLRHITGFRHRVNQLLFAGADVQGEYRPVYTDLQTYWTYDLKDNIELGFLGLYSSNRYGLVPQNRETEFGTFNQALRFTVYFEGQEVTQFQTYFGALNLNVQASRNTLLKFTLSSFKTFESERFDILAEYYLDELERDLGSDQFGEVVRNLGVGGSLDHARNDLEATVYTAAHKGFHQSGNRYLQWGADVRGESINDKLSEWTITDSAGYNTPLNQGEDVEL
ncbi:MAG: TonB-dependent receptor, partial [Bacteroidota bacterium]|nr:TonB-dependent receptor [Bacteroidota bacterium]